MGKNVKNSSAFLKSPTSTLLHTISESEKASYVAHINNYLGRDEFLKKFLPIDPSTNDLFEIAKDGVLIWLALVSLFFVHMSQELVNPIVWLIKFPFVAVNLSMLLCLEQLMNEQ